MVAADRELSPWGGRDGVVASELSHTGLTCGAVPRQRDYPRKKTRQRAGAGSRCPFHGWVCRGQGPAEPLTQGRVTHGPRWLLGNGHPGLGARLLPAL